MVVGDSLSHPHGAGSRVIGGDVEHPRFFRIDHSESFPTLAFGVVPATPVARIEPVLHGQVTHQLDGLSRRSGSFQGNSDFKNVSIKIIHLQKTYLDICLTSIMDFPPAVVGFAQKREAHVDSPIAT